jgi:hypothetical protein
VIRDGLVLLVGVGLLFPLQGAIDKGRSAPLDVLETLPPEPLLPVLAFGHRESAADLLEIRMNNALVRHIDQSERVDFEQLQRMYNAILTLDAENADAAWRGAVYLSAVADRPDVAVQLLARSLGEEDPLVPPDPDAYARPAVDPGHPRRWVLYHEMAATHFLMLRERAATAEGKKRHLQRAGELWLLAGQQPGGPEWFTNAGRKLVAQAWSAREAMEHEVRLWENRASVGSEAQREKARVRLAEARCAHLRERLQELLDGAGRAGHRVVRLRQLAPLFPQVGIETSDPHALSDLDPLGVGYFLRNGRVVAPAYEAARLERDAVDDLVTWLQQHPGEEPTAAALGLDRPPDFLRFEVSREGIRVRGVLPRPR